MKKRIEFDVDIDEFDLLRALAKELHMEFALDDNTYYIKRAEWGEPEDTNLVVADESRSTSTTYLPCGIKGENIYGYSKH